MSRIPSSRWCAALATATCLLAAGSAAAELGNFDISAKVYTKFLYQNNDSQGVLTLGNPHPNGDNYSGSNGIGTEGELSLVGRVSPRVSAGMRIKSRFGSVWHDWWENGNMTDKAPLTGETLGMDHAEYMKLRGTWMRVGTGSDLLRWLQIGSSDLSMFNAWTIGQVRYIDRDNAKGLFAEGTLIDDVLTYHLAAIALPKLFVGPGWSTGLGDARLEHPFLTRDFGYAGRFDLSLGDDWSLSSVTSFTDDLEVDREDPDATGSPIGGCTDGLGTPIPGCEHDHRVSLVPRYRNLVSTLELKGMLGDNLLPELLAAYSLTRVNTEYAVNGVQGNAGVFPIVFKDTGSGGLADVALRARFEAQDLGGSGFGFKLEYFNIGEDFSSIFGARREDDVLLTDGLVGEGQLPTLNLANEFIDFDEPWVESCIGWHGATALLGQELGPVTLRAEGTAITYNTNAQGRDIETVYPNFQHDQGFTDTDLYDYANRLDRGRDPRSVYRQDQERLTLIGVLRADWALPLGPGWNLGLKAKLVRDTDERITSRADDDYTGTMLIGRAQVDMPVTRWLTLRPGLQVERWRELNRSGAANLGYQDYETAKEKAFVGARIEYAGVAFTYYLEYLHKDQQRQEKEDQLWKVIRSKGTAEVAW